MSVDRVDFFVSYCVEMFTVPEDPAIEKADHEGVAAIDANPDSPAIVAVGELASRLMR